MLRPSNVARLGDRVNYIGLLMINHENDILADVLATHCEIVDAFYVLDGTVPNTTSRDICESFDRCGGYATDSELPRPPYPSGTTCGYRKFPHEMAVEDYGPNNWFLELHGDEIWTFDPRDVVANHLSADGFVFPLPFYFPREGQEWDDTRSPLDQLTWSLGPGWPEFRMFRGNPDVHFREEQHFNTQPQGIQRVVRVDLPIEHYPYRSPRVQRERAAIHERTGFDPDNYRHILDDGQVFWTDEMIARYQQKDCFRDLHNDTEHPLYGHRVAPAGQEAPV